MDNTPQEARPELSPAVWTLIDDVSKEIELARATVTVAIGALRHTGEGQDADVAEVLAWRVESALCAQVERLNSLTGVTHAHG